MLDDSEYKIGRDMESSVHGLERLKRTTKMLHHDSLCHCRDFNQAHPEYKSQALPQELNCSTPHKLNLNRFRDMNKTRKVHSPAHTHLQKRN